MRNQEKRLIRLVLAIFMAVGVIMAAIGIILTVRYFMPGSNTVEIPATITALEVYRDSDGDMDHDVYVDYSYEGVEYANRPISFYSSDMYEGKEIEIRIDKNNPNKIVFGGSLLLGGIFLFMGVMFLIITAFPMALAGKGAQKKKSFWKAEEFCMRR